MSRKGALAAGSLGAVLGLAGAFLIGSVVSCGPRAEGPAAVTVVAAPVHPTAPAFERLTGQWARTEGGYVLDIRQVSPEGMADVSYLNPRPIRVEQALATRGGSGLTLFVELRDVNYPGSSYNLWYDPARDVLEGTYFQAVAGETFAVSFVKR